jgi:pimeloyl-ACP methyl ester carboxylesterase
VLLKTNHSVIETKKLRYFELGDKKNSALVLLHGYPDNLQIWHKLAPLLANHYYVVGFDWPGMGESEAWEGGATPLIMANRLKKIIDHFQLKKINILAQDMGGQAGLVFASLYPNYTQSIFVMNSLLMWNEKTSWEITLLRKFRFNEFVLNYLPRLVFQRARRTFIEHGRSVIDKELENDLWVHFKKKEVRTYIVRMCAGYGAQLKKLPDYYQHIKCPVTFIWAEKGKHFSIHHAYAFKELCPRTEIVSIKGAQHWMVLNRQEEIAKILLPK